MPGPRGSQQSWKKQESDVSANTCFAPPGLVARRVFFGRMREVDPPWVARLNQAPNNGAALPPALASWLVRSPHAFPLPPFATLPMHLSSRAFECSRVAHRDLFLHSPLFLLTLFFLLSHVAPVQRTRCIWKQDLLPNSLPNSLGITQFPLGRLAPLGVLTASQAFQLFSCP